LGHGVLEARALGLERGDTRLGGSLGVDRIPARLLGGLGGLDGVVTLSRGLVRALDGAVLLRVELADRVVVVLQRGADLVEAAAEVLVSVLAWASVAWESLYWAS